MERYLLGIDIGGTSIKAGIFNKRGDLLGSSKIDNKIITFKPGWAELSPEYIWNNLPKLINDSCQNAGIDIVKIISIGFSITCPTVVPLDKDGNPLRNAIMNFDQRSSKQVSSILEQINEDKIFNVTGNKILSGAVSISSILWIKENEPDIFERTCYFGHITTYLIYKLTGRMVLDFNQASFSGFFRTRDNFTWDRDLLNVYGLDENKLPKLLSPTEMAGTISKEASKKTRLTKDTVVASGSADTVCSALGIGLFESDKIFITSGTSEIVSGCMTKPEFEKRFLNRFYIDNLWIFHGPISTSGAAIMWLKKVLDYNDETSNEEFYNFMTDMAKKSQIGSNKLLFLPYLQGERSPLWDSNARGVFFGLSMGTEVKDICRSVFESIGFALKKNIEIAEKILGINNKEVLVTGGGSKNIFWLQVKSDITGKVLYVQNFSETAMLGAAMLGGVCSNVYDDYLDAINWAAKKDYFRINPNLKNYKKYSKLSNIYDSLYNSLTSEYKKLGEVNLN